jgi:hypothetical protein
MQPLFRSPRAGGKLLQSFSRRFASEAAAPKAVALSKLKDSFNDATSGERVKVPGHGSSLCLRGNQPQVADEA